MDAFEAVNLFAQVGNLVLVTLVAVGMGLAKRIETPSHCLDLALLFVDDVKQRTHHLRGADSNTGAAEGSATQSL